MKMNVKGLVFVGFAAAVFAGAANAAGDKIVTSKSYVDAKISDAATISSSSTTTAPNEKAVYDALATKKTASELGDAAAKGVDTDFTDTTSTDLPTTAAVATYVSSQVSTAGGNYQTKSTTAQQVSDGAGGWTNLSMDTTPTANSTKPVTSGGVAAALGDYTTTTDLNTLLANKADAADLADYELLSNKVQTIDTTANAATKAANYPSQAAIESYVTTTGGNYQTKSTTAQQVSDGAGGWEALDVADTVTDGSSKPVTSGAVYTALTTTERALALKQDADVAVKVGTAGTAVGSAQKTVYVDNTGTVREGTALGAAAEKGVATTVEANGTDLPTAGAVNTAITTAINGAAANYQSKSTVAQQVSDGAGGWQNLTTTNAVTQDSATPITSGGVYTALADYQTTANMSSNMTTDTGSTSKYPTVAAVESYVTGLNNNLNLPANNTAEGTACDANNPCALVWGGTGQPEWKRIQQ